MLFRMTLVAAAVSVSGAVYAAAAQKYDIQELPFFCPLDDTSKCGTYNNAYDINNSGVVVGYAHGTLVPDVDDVDDDDNVTEEIREFGAHAYRWEGGTLIDLGDLGKNESYGFAINDDGVVVGRASTVTDIVDTTETVQVRAFQAVPNEPMVDIGEPTEVVNSVSAIDIDNDGYIVGVAGAQVVADDTEFYTRGFIKTPGVEGVVLIPSFEADSASVLRAVNSVAGKAVGYALRDGQQRAIQVALTDPSTLIELDDLGGSASAAHAINSNGIVVGRSVTDGNNTTEGFVYDPLQVPAVRSIGLLSSRFIYSTANAINENGDVVGSAQASAAPSSYHAVFFDTASNELIDLNTRIDCAPEATERWVLTEALAINDSGQIIGYGTRGLETRSFLLTPSLSTDAPVVCEANEGEFENQSGGGAFSWLLLPALLLLGRRRNT